MSENQQKKASERRKTKRFSTPIELEYRTLTQNPIFGSACARDVSKGGISFASESAMEQGTNVEFRMNVPGDNIPIFATGTVAWTEGRKKGVKINQIGKGDQTKIFEHIYREWLKTRPNGKKKKDPNK